MSHKNMKIKIKENDWYVPIVYLVVDAIAWLVVVTAIVITYVLGITFAITDFVESLLKRFKHD